MAQFIPAGPKRFAHQIRGLKKLLENGGMGALLFDPGLGKTATTIDLLSILALKKAPVDGVREVRVLVTCPLAAVDTWVKQAALYVHGDVNYWAEAISGSIPQRAETMAARGGQPIVRKGKRKSFREVNGVRMEEPIRAEGWGRSIDWGARAEHRTVLASDGPDGLGKDKPRLIIIVTNLDTFSSRQKSGSKTMADTVLDGVKRYAPDIVIVDESHKIKSATSNISRLVDRVGALVKRRVILTGTVMPAGPLDIFGQWRFLDPYAFGERQPDGSIKRTTFDTFKRRFAVMGGYMGHEVIGYRNLDELQKIMGYLASVAKKEDALDLPPLTPIVVPVLLSTAERQAYNDMKKNLMTQLTSGGLASSPNKLTQMMRLRQITSGHLPDDFGVVHQIGDSKVKTIVELANDTLAEKRRVVIFCLFTHEFHAIVDGLQKKGTVVMGINGETPKDERIRFRMRFGSGEEQRMVLVAQVKTLSLAVNELVTSQDVIFGSLSLQRDDLIQAIDRLNRIGQTGAMTAWFVEAPGTIDTVIHAAHDDRTDMETAVLKHILGDDLDAVADFSNRDSSIVVDPRLPGLTSMTPEDVKEAIGDFNGEDETPIGGDA